MTDNNTNKRVPRPPTALASNASPAAKHAYAHELAAFLDPASVPAADPSVEDKAARLAAFKADVATLPKPLNEYEQAQHATVIESLIKKHNLL